jgi:CHAD domain-containing protein/CYTH domain-containing protein
MSFPPDLLERPAAESARLVAQIYLARARSARRVLDDGTSPEALHDFRVAIRRLRSWLRAFRPELDDTVSRRTRRGLRTLAASTGECRDLEVFLTWVRSEIDLLPPPERPDAVWLIERLTERMAAAQGRCRHAIDRRFDRLSDRLDRALGSYRVAVGAEGPTRLPTAGEVLGRRLEPESERLALRLAEFWPGRAEGAGHAARIAAKRVRYLLEPFEAELAGTPRILGQLTRIQDMLGEWRETLTSGVVMAEMMADPDGDTRPGLATLRFRLGTRGEAALARFEASWHESVGGDCLGELAALIRALKSAPPDIEIERKYLLRGVPPHARGVPPVEIDQGYLPGDRIGERVRRSRTGDTLVCHRTIKAGTGLTRIEIEETITRRLFEQLWALAGVRRLRKRRYVVPAGDLAWEIDEFLDRDLVLAEIELPSEQTPVTIPAWLEEWMVREVTDDPRYLNRNLARRRRVRRRRRARSPAEDP